MEPPPYDSLGGDLDLVGRQDIIGGSYGQPELVDEPLPVETSNTPATSVIVHPNTSSSGSDYSRYNGTIALRSGIAQMVAGLVAMIASIIGISVQRVRRHNGLQFGYVYGSPDARRHLPNRAFYLASGIWCALFFFLSGGLAILAARKKTRVTLLASQLAAVLSLVFGFVVLSNGVTAMNGENKPLYSVSYGDSLHYPNDALHQTSQAMAVILMLMGVTEVVLACMVFLFGCAVTCRKTTDGDSRVVYHTSSQQTRDAPDSTDGSQGHTERPHNYNKPTGSDEFRFDEPPPSYESLHPTPSAQA